MLILAAYYKTTVRQLGIEREFKEICQNLRKFWSSKGKALAGQIDGRGTSTKIVLTVRFTSERKGLESQLHVW